MVPLLLGVIQFGVQAHSVSVVLLFGETLFLILFVLSSIYIASVRTKPKVIANFVKIGSGYILFPKGYNASATRVCSFVFGRPGYLALFVH
jgi:hypothetical protein